MRKYLVMVMVLVFVLTTIGIVRAEERVTSEEKILTTNDRICICTFTFPFGTKFYVAEDKNVLQYQLPGEQTWKEIPLHTGYTITRHTPTYTISKHEVKKITDIKITAISHRDTKEILLIIPDFIIQRHSLRRFFLGKFYFFTFNLA